MLPCFADMAAEDRRRSPAAGRPVGRGVTDDPEGAEVLAEAGPGAGLPDDLGGRVHLACLPMDDVEENAAMVNALQRRADVVVQKSLREGFGLTVAEAMWKGRPVVASRVGGIQDQIVDGESGLLVDDPTDLRAAAAAIELPSGDPDRAAAIGVAARERSARVLPRHRHLVQYMQLIEEMLRADGGSAG